MVFVSVCLVRFDRVILLNKVFGVLVVRVGVVLVFGNIDVIVFIIGVVLV